jgi:hypothetical protein
MRGFAVTAENHTEIAKPAAPPAETKSRGDRVLIGAIVAGIIAIAAYQFLFCEGCYAYP